MSVSSDGFTDGLQMAFVSRSDGATRLDQVGEPRSEAQIHHGGVPSIQWHFRSVLHQMASYMRMRIVHVLILTQNTGYYETRLSEQPSRSAGVELYLVI